MRLAILSTLAFVIGTSVPGLAAADADDTSFVQSAQQDLLGEYALATLAKNKAENPTAKSLAQQIVANAAQATDFIRAYAKTHAVSLDGKPSTRADNQYGNISSDDKSSFDGDFAKAIFIDANIALDNYKDEAAHGSDPALRDFAKKEAAAMEQFAKTAQKLAPQ